MVAVLIFTGEIRSILSKLIISLCVLLVILLCIFYFNTLNTSKYITRITVTLKTWIFVSLSSIQFHSYSSNFYCEMIKCLYYQNVHRDFRTGSTKSWLKTLNSITGCIEKTSVMNPVGNDTCKVQICESMMEDSFNPSCRGGGGWHITLSPLFKILVGLSFEPEIWHSGTLSCCK